MRLFYNSKEIRPKKYWKKLFSVPIKRTQLVTYYYMLLKEGSKKSSRLRRLQAQTLPDASLPIGKVNQFIKKRPNF